MATRSRPGPAASPLRAINRVERALDQLRDQGKEPARDARLYAQAVLDEVSDVGCAILIANNHGRYITANAAASALTGYPRTQLLRMSVWDLTPAATQAEGRERWRQFLRMQRMRGVYEIRRRNGDSVRARFAAVANIVSGLHLSALVPIGAAPPRERRAKTTRAKRATTKATKKR